MLSVECETLIQRKLKIIVKNVDGTENLNKTSVSHYINLKLEHRISFFLKQILLQKFSLQHPISDRWKNLIYEMKLNFEANELGRSETSTTTTT